MRKILLFMIPAVLLLGAMACSDDSSDSSDSAAEEVGEEEAPEEETASEDADAETGEFDQGSPEALAAIEDVVANGLAEDYGPAEVSCPPEIAEGEGVYECDVTFEDGATAVATVSTEGSSIDLQGVEPNE